MQITLQQQQLQGHWAGVSGSIEEGETPRQCAEREIKEETSLGNVHLNASCIEYECLLP